MITAAYSANGVEEIQVGASRVRRSQLPGLLAEREKLEAQISHLQALASGPVYARRS